jgi:hypothetical protein
MIFDGFECSITCNFLESTAERSPGQTPGPASEVRDPLLRGGADFSYPCFRTPPQNLVGPSLDANMQLDERRSRRKD